MAKKASNQDLTKQKLFHLHMAENTLKSHRMSFKDKIAKLDALDSTLKLMKFFATSFSCIYCHHIQASGTSY